MRYWWTALAISLGGIGLHGAPVSWQSRDLVPYRNCLSRLEGLQHYYARWLPPSLVALDRKLARMNEGVPFLKENLTLIIAKGPSRGGGDLLLSNAVLGCEAYQVRFRQSAALYARLLGCLGLLIASLGVGIALPVESTVSAEPANDDRSLPERMAG